MSIKTKLMTACAGVLLVGGIGATVASAKITVVIRDTAGGVESAPLTVADLNKPITLNIFAQVTGDPTNAGKETLKSLQGAVTTNGGSKANVAPGFYWPDPDGGPDLGPVTPWGDPNNDKYNMSGSASQSGLKQDIDGDNDIDLGGKAGDPTANWIIFRTDKSNMAWGAGGQGTKILTNGVWMGDVEFQVGVITVTPTALSTNTLVAFMPRADATGKQTKDAGLWTEDGTAAANLRDGSSGTFGTGGGYLLVVPEPASLSMLGLGAAMLLGQRNRK